MELRQTLSSLCHRGFFTSEIDGGREIFGLTAEGGKMWSSERCPEWSRYCTERYRTTIRNRTMMTVVAVSDVVRDDFLHYWPMYPARRRATMVSDFGLVPWRTFGRLHVGVATYIEVSEWTAAEIPVYLERYKKYESNLDENQSWWRTVSELQRFAGQGSKPS
ncbi:MAG: hypothetical protein R3C03_06750 [Pirellulaceae bacterium]